MNNQIQKFFTEQQDIQADPVAAFQKGIRPTRFYAITNKGLLDEHPLEIHEQNQETVVFKICPPSALSLLTTTPPIPLKSVVSIVKVPVVNNDLHLLEIISGER